MTTSEIIAQANIGGIASPDLDLHSILVHCVIPEMEDVTKRAWWRRKASTISALAGTRRYALPNDLDSIVHLKTQAEGDNLPYIGEDPLKVLAGETAEAGAIGGYYVEIGGPGGEEKGLTLDRPPVEDQSLYVLYDRLILTPEDGTGFDLVTRMPRRLHWGLVEGLKREIYMERVGKDDQRTVIAAQAFEMWKGRAAAFREAGRHGEYVRDVF